MIYIYIIFLKLSRDTKWEDCSNISGLQIVATGAIYPLPASIIHSCTQPICNKYKMQALTNTYCQQIQGQTSCYQFCFSIAFSSGRDLSKSGKFWYFWFNCRSGAVVRTNTNTEKIKIQIKIQKKLQTGIMCSCSGRVAWCSWIRCLPRRGIRCQRANSFTCNIYVFLVKLQSICTAFAEYLIDIC